MSNIIALSDGGFVIIWGSWLQDGSKFGVYAQRFNSENAKIGDEFDAELHEAITQIPAPSENEKGKIIDIVEIGYQLGDRIIRYPKVVVGQ